ncbi:MAG: crossover junction endodeoxyribonuclease RuvC [bacterium]|nr:crossover junction endodeoxyribonuclease RuvC [bacterium]
MPRASDAPRRILGIDPALRVTGYGVIDCAGRTVRLVEAGIVNPRTDRALEDRLLDIHRGIAEIIEQTKPDVVVIEELYTTYKNPMTAILMGHARGVMCLASAQAGVPVHTLGHAHVKRALVGSGAARKEQINAMVTRLLKLTSAPKPNDVSDALAIALAFANMTDHVLPY